MTTSIKFRALTDEDHKLFFEALGEHGKDFQNIQQYITQKASQKTSGKSGDSKLIDPQEKKESEKREEDRKREQIRNFYNKLYAKLSELVGKIDDRVEKVNQELYLLINYGEIWKRHGFKFNAKTKRLLEELVYQGTTTFRFEKKNVRLRTPACKALKKINEIGIDEKVKVVTTRELPKDVLVEFHPASNRDWLKVQSMSQNPRVRARLPIQKRMSSILEFLENKWNISQDKLVRTVDSLLKITPASNNHISEIYPNNNLNEFNCAIKTDNQDTLKVNTADIQNESTAVSSTQQRIRLKPSSHHELNEVNITRVVPENHLDLSLNAYIKRLELTKPKSEEQVDEHQSIGFKSSTEQQGQAGKIHTEDSVISTSAAAMNSRLPVSLTTPDCSILLERSCTSDQPSIAQARRHLTILQSLTGALEGCENSRTAYEDTQDRSLMNMLMNNNSRCASFPSQTNTKTQQEQPSQQNPTIMVNNDIPALYDEDAALPISSSVQTLTPSGHLEANNLLDSSIMDSQNSKSVDFQIPKNVTLGDYFKMTEAHNECGADEIANDAFPLDVTSSSAMDDESDHRDGDKVSDEHVHEQVPTKETKPQDHVIEIKKFAEGWTRQNDTSITLGELYLTFKCPDKLILEYEFEQLVTNNNQDKETVQAIHEIPSDNSLMFKFLTAASLSLARIERQKQEQQHKLHEQQSCSKLKRRKGSGQNHTMTQHDIETTNQLVEEALKQLQPTRLSSYRKARRDCKESFIPTQ